LAFEKFNPKWPFKEVDRRKHVKGNAGMKGIKIMKAKRAFPVFPL